MTNHLRLRHNTWSVRLTVPADVRELIGKREFQQSLETHDKRVAEARAGELLTQWRLQILAARGNHEAASYHATQIRLADKGAIDPATGMSDADHYADYVADQLPDAKKQAFFDALHGRATPFDVLLEDFLKGYQVEEKTKAMAKSAIQEVKKQFKTIESVSKKAVLNWIREDTRKKTTINKNLGFVRSYWKYLQEQELASEALNPFSALGLKDKAKAKAAKREAFADVDVPKLWKAAEGDKDQLLADLIRLAAYTGARLEELCCLRTEDVIDDGNVPCFRITDAKTEAGNRTVPIHPLLAPTVARLREESSDGYLIHGQAPSKYGDRSNAIGKRFGRLKKKLGFGASHVFHSIRKTVTTQMENGGIAEGIAADVVGHEKATITYGLYSAGNTPMNKLRAIKLLSYPEPHQDRIGSLEHE